MEPILIFNISNQEIERVDEFTVVESSVSYLKSQFNPQTDDWDGMIITGVFIMEDGRAIPSLADENGICDVPSAWLVKQKGYVGAIGSDGVTTITTRAARVSIREKGYTSETVDEEAQGYFDQIIQAFAKTKEFVTQEADRAEDARKSVEETKNLVAQMSQDVADSKESVEQTVDNFDLIHQQAIVDVNNTGQTQAERVEGTGNRAIEDIETIRQQAVQSVTDEGDTQKKGIKEEGAAQVAEIHKASEGIAQEPTAQEILEKSDQSLRFLEQIAEAAGKAGSLNGFGLEKGANDSLAITYTNPETEELEGTVMLPTETTIEKIDEALSGINKSLKIIALQKGVEA